LFLDVPKAIKHLWILKKIWDKGYMGTEQKRRLKFILFSEQGHPLKSKVLKTLEQQHHHYQQYQTQSLNNDKWLRSCANMLELIINEERFSHCKDIIDILLTDENSESMRKRSFSSFSSSYTVPSTNFSSQMASSSISSSAPSSTTPITSTSLSHPAKSFSNENGPFDLETIRLKIEKREYLNPNDFVKDMQILFNNQLKRNASTQITKLKQKFDSLVEYLQ
jgi:hypothetical protein